MATIGKASGAIQDAIKGTTGVGIAQDNIIFGVVLLAFVLWIIQKGELQTYLSFFKGQGGGFQPVPVTGSSAASTTGTSTPVTGLFPGTTNAPGSGIVGQILNPSTDPVAGPVSTIIKAIPNIPGFAVGLGN
jgi:hypothetical protein